MGIADRVSAFMSTVGSNIPPVLSHAAGSSLQQMQAAARHVGVTAGSLLAGTPGGQYQANIIGNNPLSAKGNPIKTGWNPGQQRPVVAGISQTLPTTGLMGMVGMGANAPGIQAQFQNPAVAQNVGMGIMGAGALAAAGGMVAANSMRDENKKRMAGQYL